MDENARRIVVESAGQVFAAKGRLAEAFYAHLFRVAPETQPLFDAQMRHQYKMLMSALAVIVGALGDPERLKTTLDYLGRLHARRSVTAAYLAIGAEAFDLAICDFFGERCTPELRAAWADAYTEIAERMLTASSEPETSPAE